MKLPPESELYDLPEASRTNFNDVFAEKLNLEDAREIMADVLEDTQRTRARQLYDDHGPILRVLAKLERNLTTNYGVKPKQGKPTKRAIVVDDPHRPDRVVL